MQEVVTDRRFLLHYCGNPSLATACSGGNLPNTSRLSNQVDVVIPSVSFVLQQLFNPLYLLLDCLNKAPRVLYLLCCTITEGLIVAQGGVCILKGVCEAMFFEKGKSEVEAIITG